jgi:rubrerythrin
MGKEKKMGFKDLNDIIDFAIEREKEAQAFYAEIAKEESMSGTREMLEEFAKMEQKHEVLLQKFKDKGLDESIGNYGFKWIKDIKRSDYVVEMRYEPGLGYGDILLIASQREGKALKLYNELLAQAEDEDAKHLFKMLCQEEAKHKQIFETKYDDYMAEMGD